jgi:membrane complex biogenesis BtpA family protein
MTLLKEWSNLRTPVIGMLHLLPLPGSPRFGGSIEEVKSEMLADAEALAEGGVHGLMLENFNDVPFFPGAVPPGVIAHMTALACDVRKRFELPLGINVLRNDSRAALAIAQACGGKFIRVNILCSARLTDQGIIQGIAHDLLRDRATLKADVKILADVDVKHSAALAPRALADEVADMLHRGLADALIVSGSATGHPTDLEHVRAAKQAAGAAAVFIGSGVTAENAGACLSCCAGFIVGSSLNKDGRVQHPVDSARVRALIAALAE